MYTLNGFVAVGALANSSPTEVATIGEISTRSLTFARGVGEYSNAILPYRLYSFYSKTEVGQIAVPNDLFAQILAIVDWAFTKQKSGTPATTSTSFIAALAAQFGANVNSVGCGSLVNTGAFQFPEYISWINPNIVTNDSEGGATVKLWFSDLSFQAQYPHYELVVIPPVAAIDNLMSGYAAAKAAVDAMTIQATLNAMQNARGAYPETLTVPATYDYVDASNPTNTVQTTWTVLAYGAQGNNVDHIRAAVQAYIAANSSHTLAEWRIVMPGLYTSTEFLLFPRWNDYAVAEMVYANGAYSSIVNLAKQLAYLKTVLSTFSPTYIDAHACVIPANYKSAMVLAVPGATNPVGVQNLESIFDDLMNLPTTDPLFGEMRLKTRNWVVMLASMLLVAETATAQTTPPAGMSLVVRGSVLYIAQTYSGVAYLVAVKSTLPGY